MCARAKVLLKPVGLQVFFCSFPPYCLMKWLLQARIMENQIDKNMEHDMQTGLDLCAGIFEILL